MAYTKTTWVDDSSPYINASNLNHIEQGIADAHDLAAAGGGGGGLPPGLLTTKGDIIVALSGGSAGKLPVAASGFLTPDATTSTGLKYADITAADIDTGTFDPARLGSGTSITTKFLRGDATWQTIVPGSTTLAGLTDVLITSAAISQVIRHDGTKWVNAALVATDIASGTLAIARIPTGTTGTTVALGNHAHAGVYEPVITAGTTSQYRRGDKTWQTLDKAAVGLANVDNTSDANKPVSTAQQTALDLKTDVNQNLADIADPASALINIGPVYNRVQNNGVDKIKQFNLNFSSAFTVTNSGASGVGSTTVDLLPSFRMRSTTAQDITSAVTGSPVAVTGASFTLPDNSTGVAQEYDLEMRVKYESTGVTAGTGNDIQFDMSFPTGVTADGGILGNQSGASGSISTFNNVSLTESTGPRIFGGIGTGGDTSLRVYISITIVVPAGNVGGTRTVQLLAAPNANNDVAANSTRILALAGTAIRVT